VRLVTRVVALAERLVAAVAVPLTYAAAFVLRRGRFSRWQRAQRRGAA
jgi:hypothetical protein